MTCCRVKTKLEKMSPRGGGRGGKYRISNRQRQQLPEISLVSPGQWSTINATTFDSPLLTVMTSDRKGHLDENMTKQGHRVTGDMIRTAY